MHVPVLLYLFLLLGAGLYTSLRAIVNRLVHLPRILFYSVKALKTKVRKKIYCIMVTSAVPLNVLYSRLFCFLINFASNSLQGV